MEIGELSELRKEAERKINGILEELQNQTGLHIHKVNISFADMATQWSHKEFGQSIIPFTNIIMKI